MTNTDSFIAEVSEEVRRDRLFRLFKRYGWIGILAILLIVGAAGYREWNNAQQRSAAESFGDGLLAAISQPDTDSKIRALAELQADGDRKALVGFVRSAVLADAGESGGAVNELAAVAGDRDISTVYRQLAELKAIWAQVGGMPLEEKLDRLSPLEEPGAPFRLLASETRAHALIAHGRVSEAVEILRRIQQEAAVPQDLRQRTAQLLATLETDTSARNGSE